MIQNLISPKHKKSVFGLPDTDFLYQEDEFEIDLLMNTGMFIGLRRS